MKQASESPDITIFNGQLEFTVEEFIRACLNKCTTDLEDKLSKYKKIVTEEVSKVAIRCQDRNQGE